MTIVAGMFSPQGIFASVSKAYLEPGLLAQKAGEVSVIVTAKDAGYAAQTVERFGGKVSANLWLINAVAATMPADQLQALAVTPGVNSIVQNKGVQTSGRPDWVTERRIIKKNYALGGTQLFPPLVLQDGSLFSITDKGMVKILYQDGSLRSSLTLTGGSFLTAPILGTDGTIYLAGQKHILYAINPDGTIRWTYTEGGTADFVGGVAQGPDRTLYVADKNRNIFAVDSTSGRMRWKYLAAQASGVFYPGAVVGNDGTLYALTDAGHLLALDGNGIGKWNFIPSILGNYKLPPFLAVDGTLFFANLSGKLYAVNPNGTLKFMFTALGKINANPVMSADGALYFGDDKGGLYCVNPDGSLRFKFQTALGGILTTPLLSPDERTVFLAVNGKYLLAVDAGQWA